MTLQIASLNEKYLEDAAKLVCARYQALRQQEPLLPARYEHIEAILRLLAELIDAAPGVAVTHEGRLVGFMTGYLIPDFMGVRSAYSPEWANSAEPQDCQRIYESMCERISFQWVGEGCDTHALTLFAHDGPCIQAFQWLAFGLAGVDGIRELRPLDHDPIEIDLRQAGLRHAPAAAELIAGLERHMAAAPIFWSHELGDVRVWLENSLNAMWLANQGDENGSFQSTSC